MKKIFMTKNRNHGFTLIEIISVLVLLAIISAITVPVIDRSIKLSRNEALERNIETIEEASYRYSLENDLGFSTQLQPLYLTVLKSKGYLEDLIVNPTTNEEMTGCVWYNWNINYSRYDFLYDEECENPPIEPSEPDIDPNPNESQPTVNITYNKELLNKNGWINKDLAITFVGVGRIKYCIGNNECEPTNVIEDSNTIFLTSEGVNYICANSSNSNGTTDVICEIIKLDKTLPTIEGISDLVVEKNSLVDLKTGIKYDDIISGVETLIIEPNEVDTTIAGTKQVTYKVQDKAGNIREVIRNVIVDAEAPTIIFDLIDKSVINSNGWANKDFYVRATITDNSGSGIKSASSCTTNNNSECTPTANFTGTTKDFLISVEGNNRACIEVTDNNNKTSKICSDIYKLDKTAPNIVNVGITTLDDSISVNTIAIDNMNPMTYYYKIDSNDYISINTSSYTFINLEYDNTYVINVYVEDIAGNISSVVSKSQFLENPIEYYCSQGGILNEDGDEKICIYFPEFTTSEQCVVHEYCEEENCIDIPYVDGEDCFTVGSQEICTPHIHYEESCTPMLYECGCSQSITNIEWDDCASGWENQSEGVCWRPADVRNK